MTGTITAAFQGIQGAFSEDAAIHFFGNAETLPCSSFKDVFEVVLSGAVEYGVIPIENSFAGSINETYDLLLHYPLTIYGEIKLRVHHNLVALPGTTPDTVKTVYSHPQALAQCQEFLDTLNVETMPLYDTAGSARKIKEDGNGSNAAIASERAAHIYGLTILASHIESNEFNYTRFCIISKNDPEPAAKNKTSLVFAAKNIPGALYHILGVFATRNINLIKLESRPSKDKPWTYVFYVDFEGHKDDALCREALAELDDMVSFIKILGSYPVAQTESD
jgi:prephenate dehydratase